MRRLLPFLLVLAFGIPVVTAQEPGSPHSPAAADVFHEPPAPVRGQDVAVTLELEPGYSLERALLVYCRLPQYTCGPPLAMEPGPEGLTWSATIPWDRPDEGRPARFWKGALHVGYNVTLDVLNGANQTTPLKNSPYTPEELPAGSHYYFYRLPAEPGGVPGVGALAAVTALTAAIVWRRRSA